MSYTEMQNNEMALQVINEQEVLGKQFRVYGTFEEPLFLAKDVAEWIEHSNVSKMLNSVDEDEKVKRFLGITNSYGQVVHGGIRENVEMWFLTEDGLYEVLMQSRKPIAKQFKKQVKAILKGLRMGEIILVPQLTPKEELQLAILNGDPIESLIALQKFEEMITTPLIEIIEEQAPKVDFFTKFLDTERTFTSTQVGKTFGYSSGRAFNSLLKDSGYIYKQGKTWHTYATTPKGWFKETMNEYGTQLRITSFGVVELSKVLEIKLEEQDLKELISELEE